MQTTPLSTAASDGLALSDIAVVESFFAELAGKNLDGALALLTDDVVYQNVPFPPDRGKAAVRRTFNAFGYFVTDFAVEMRHIAARGGVVLTDRIDVMTGPLVYLDLHVSGTFEL